MIGWTPIDSMKQPTRACLLWTESRSGQQSWRGAMRAMGIRSTSHHRLWFGSKTQVFLNSSPANSILVGTWVQCSPTAQPCRAGRTYKDRLARPSSFWTFSTSPAQTRSRSTHSLGQRTAVAAACMTSPRIQQRATTSPRILPLPLSSSACRRSWRRSTPLCFCLTVGISHQPLATPSSITAASTARLWLSSKHQRRTSGATSPISTRAEVHPGRSTGPQTRCAQ
mmetsp:Transcript_20642/g.68296  ORF Transcript_20642/g.68296 Transcript_20642/m.68296 type:complete len:225 (-) Transcript_20642:407-1081(-)